MVVKVAKAFITKQNLGHSDKFEKELLKISRRSSRFPGNPEFLQSFQVVVL